MTAVTQGPWSWTDVFPKITQDSTWNDDFNWSGERHTAVTVRCSYLSPRPFVLRTPFGEVKKLWLNLSVVLRPNSKSAPRQANWCSPLPSTQMWKPSGPQTGNWIMSLVKWAIIIHYVLLHTAQIAGEGCCGLQRRQALLLLSGVKNSFKWKSSCVLQQMEFF